MKTNLLILIFMFFLIKCYAGRPMPTPKPRLSAIYVFGDSLVDTGNNNFLHTTLKANYNPYGLDFPTHNSTGRFSNGKVLPDMIASSLGIKDVVPPFLNVDNLSNADLISGVNFASAGAGFDDFTTLQSNAAPVSEQLFFFANYLSKLTRIVGEPAAKKIVDDSLVIISAGTYDWIVNYYNPPQMRKKKYTIEGYAKFLLHKTQEFVQQLYDIGCRRIIVVGVPPIGCLPYQQMSGPANNIQGRSCISSQVLDAIAYNTKLQNLLGTMRPKLAEAKVFYANVFDPLYDMISNPMKFGFVETMKGCCVGSQKSTFMCEAAKPCKNPSQYVFWDSIHPTQIVNQHLAHYIQLSIFPYLL